MRGDNKNEGRYKRALFYLLGHVVRYIYIWTQKNQEQKIKLSDSKNRSCDRGGAMADPVQEVVPSRLPFVCCDVPKLGSRGVKSTAFLRTVRAHFLHLLIELAARRSSDGPFVVTCT